MRFQPLKRNHRADAGRFLLFSTNKENSSLVVAFGRRAFPFYDATRTIECHLSAFRYGIKFCCVFPMQHEDEKMNLEDYSRDRLKFLSFHVVSVSTVSTGQEFGAKERVDPAIKTRHS